jgi:histidinol-phosphate phosphatase family protein
MKQAIILAGGKGTRLSSILNGLPKPLVDIDGLPLLTRQILLLKEYRFTDIIILVNHAAEKIIDYCNANNNWGLNVTCIDDGQPKGTAGAVLNIFNELSNEFLVMYGDTMLDVDLDKFHLFHKLDNSTAATLFLHPNDHPSDSDLVEIDSENRVLAFNPYPHGEVYLSNLVNAALYWINKNSLKKWVGVSTMFDFGKDLFPQMLNNNLIIRGYNSFEYIKDCGTPERVTKVTNDLRSGKISRSKLSHKQKAIFIDRDGTINEEVNHLAKLDSFKLLPNISKAIKRLNLSEFRICIVTNQPVIARGDLTFQELKIIHNKLETEIGKEGAYVDRIYVCPHHPDSGYEKEISSLKINCNCRKPNIGLLKQATEDLNIDLHESWFIGDTTTDILTAKNANIKSILVKTGYAGLDNKYNVLPDFEMPDLFTATNFIIDVFPKIETTIINLEPLLKNNKFIFIGGLSRSGKSTFSKVLEFYLSKSNKVHLISIDRWLKNENERTPSVKGRYDIEGIINFLKKVSSNEVGNIAIPFYDKKNKKMIIDSEKINFTKDDIFIIEGTISLYFSQYVQFNTLKLFIKIDEKNRKQRLIDEYIIRGYNIEEAEEIYFNRQIDETSIVNEQEGFMNVNKLNFSDLNN